MTDEVFHLTQLGTVRCDAHTVAEVPSEGLPSDVVLDEAYLDALHGVEVGDFIYVLALFHLADPRVHQGSPGTDDVQGAFSIRSSCRPNRIGMTLSRVTAVDGNRVSFEWLDFVDGSPVIDLKRYNWRWEIALSTRRMDRRFIERQIPLLTLAQVMARPAAAFHGEHCEQTRRAGLLGAQLVHEHDLRLTDPGFRVRVHGDGHLLDSIQAITGATFGNDRLSFETSTTDGVVELDGPAQVIARWTNDRWSISSLPPGASPRMPPSLCTQSHNQPATTTERPS